MLPPKYKSLLFEPAEMEEDEPVVFEPSRFDDAYRIARRKRNRLARRMRRINKIYRRGH
jgi:hypothetical protein